MLMFSFHHINNLSCLSVDSPFCVLNDKSITLQFWAGLKQDRANHISLPVCLTHALDNRLCPVHHMAKYLDVTHPLLSSQVLFIMTIPPHGAATWGTLWQWFTLILEQAGIEAFLGYSWVAAALVTILRDFSINTIMESSDWASAWTIYVNYLRLMPDSTV